MKINKQVINRVPQRNLSIKDWKEITRIMRELKLQDTEALTCIIVAQQNKNQIYFE